MTPEQKQIAKALRAARGYLQDGITHHFGKRYQICAALDEAYLQGKISDSAARAAQQYVMNALHPQVSVPGWLERKCCLNAREVDVYMQYVRWTRSRIGTSPVRKPPAIVRAIMDYRHRWIAHMLKELRYG